MRNTILCGDALTQLRTLPDESVHCVVTSPPYWGLRDYGVDGQIGLEATPEEFVAGMVEVFREVRRVLRADGTVWLNLGDSYAGSGRGMNGDGSVGKHGEKQHTNNGANLDLSEIDRGKRTSPRWGGGNLPSPDGLKPKDLVGIPWRVAFALQADGWWLRSDIIWSKPNPMPESVTDRPTKAHEYLFLLSKSATYYYDNEAIREQAIHEGRIVKATGDAAKNGQKGDYGRTAEGFTDHDTLVSGRNKRTVWEVATQPYSGAHFATFPEDLIRPCIQAGTSEWGCCEVCGAPWERVFDKEYLSPIITTGTEEGRLEAGRNRNVTRMGDGVRVTTTGWEPTCKHEATIKPAIVLDPFFGSGTTGYVAAVCGRDWIGIELNPSYVELAENRLLRVKARLL